MSRPMNAGRVLVPVLAMVGIIVCALLVLQPSSAPLGVAAARADSVDFSDREAVAVLAMIGLTPENMALAGAGTEQLAAAMALVEAEPASCQALLQSAEAARIAAGALADVKRAIALGGTTDERRIALANAEAAAQTARGNLNLEISDLRKTVLAGLPASLVDGPRGLSNIIANSHRSVDPAHRALRLGEPQWSTLESALKKSRFTGEALSAAEADALALAQFSADVAACAQNHETHLPLLLSAMGDAVSAAE